jgi:hypothetical protein
MLFVAYALFPFHCSGSGRICPLLADDVHRTQGWDCNQVKGVSTSIVEEWFNWIIFIEIANASFRAAPE